MNERIGVDDLIAETGATAADVDALPRVELQPELAAEALHGLPGRIVRAIDPYTEAAPVATLAHLLVGAGNLIGAAPHARVQADRHPCRFYVALVGATSKGRKGTAWSTPRDMLFRVDDVWARTRVVSGLSSGEGLIYHVRDARAEQQPVREGKRVTGYESVVVDHGEPDKRLLVFESELGSVLRRMGGETNTLSAILRQAWDSGDLATLTKNSPLRATGAHVSVVGHITREELAAGLTDLDRANGFANRFMFILVARSKLLPEGAAVPESVLAPLVEELRKAIRFARGLDVVRRDDEAREVWGAVYRALSDGKPGLTGAVVSRAEAHVLRLSVIYAALDRSRVVRRPHLQAALALWDYAEASAGVVFGGRLGLPLAEQIVAALRASGPMDKTAISGVLGRNRSAAEIDAALAELEKQERARTDKETTAGRPRHVWRLTDRADLVCSYFVPGVTSYVDLTRRVSPGGKYERNEIRSFSEKNAPNEITTNKPPGDDARELSGDDHRPVVRKRPTSPPAAPGTVRSGSFRRIPPPVVPEEVVDYAEHAPRLERERAAIKRLARGDQVPAKAIVRRRP